MGPNTRTIFLPRNCMNLSDNVHDTEEECSLLHIDFHSGLCVSPLVESFQLRAAARPMDCRSGWFIRVHHLAGACLAYNYSAQRWGLELKR